MSESGHVLMIDWCGGNCPVQAEGKINGKPFYFRARGECWSHRHWRRGRFRTRLVL